MPLSNIAADGQKICEDLVFTNWRGQNELTTFPEVHLAAPTGSHAHQLRERIGAFPLRMLMVSTY